MCNGLSAFLWYLVDNLQGDHSPGKHGKVRELDSGQGKMEKVRESYNRHLAAPREKDITAFLRYQSRHSSM